MLREASFSWFELEPTIPTSVPTFTYHQDRSNSLVSINPLPADMVYIRLGTIAREKHLSGYLAFNRIQTCVLTGSRQELKVLVFVLLTRWVVVHFWVMAVTREEDMLANIAKETEVNSFRRDVKFF